MTVNIDGYYAGYNLDIYCRSGKRCYVTCGGAQNACQGTTLWLEFGYISYSVTCTATYCPTVLGIATIPNSANSDYDFQQFKLKRIKEKMEMENKKGDIDEME